MSILNSENLTNDQSIIDDEIQQTSSLNQNETKQKIYLQGNDNSNTYNIFENECDIYASKNSSESRINASNKIKVNRLVNYEWEQRYSYGNLIAIHKSGEYFAYAIRMENSGKVRVFHRKLNEKLLLKSFKGRVVDLSFAYSDQDVILGCVDETGSLQVFKVFLDSDSKIQATLILHLLNTPKTDKPVNSIDRVFWCMYVPEPTDEQNTEYGDASKLFALSRKGRIDIFNLDTLLLNYECSEPLEPNDLPQGHLVIDTTKSGSVLTACFSPDGTALAIASSNGEVHFYKFSNPIQSEVKKSDEDNTESQEDIKYPSTPNCLKVWRPHEGKSISSLYFLDDHKNSSAEVEFWSFMLTGADYNREIKLWSCFNWTCLQTLNFYPSPLDEGFITQNPNKSIQTTLPIFKTTIDLSSKYLIMSDITRKCFYVLHLSLDQSSYSCRCSAISEYILAYPALSFTVIDIQQIKAKKYNQLNNLTSGNMSTPTDLTNTEANTDLLNISLTSSNSLNPTNGVPQLTSQDQEQLITVIRLYCIQTKQLQEMHIFLTGDTNMSSFNNNSNSPPPPLIPISTTTSLNQSTSLLQQLLPNQALLSQKKELIEDKLKSQEKLSEDSAIIQIVTPPIMVNTFPPPILMTPDAFINSPNTRKSSEPAAQQKIEMLQNLLSSSTTSAPGVSNLLSSRTSSLTQVTNPVQELKTHSSLTKLNGSHKLKNRTHSSSSSSTTSSSSSSSSSSDMDQDDKEIAALSSSNKSLKMKKTEILLEKVKLEENASELRDSEIRNGPNWPNPPDLNSQMDMKNLLVQMTQMLYKQNEEIQSLKKINFQQNVAIDEQKLNVLFQQTINNSLMPKLDKVIRDEVTKSVQTQLGQKILDPLREQLSRDLADKVRSIENTLKDSLGKIFKSKTTIDTMSQSITNSMQGVIVNTYRETFQKYIVPNFEKSCQNMYQQVNSSFSKGTQDYLAEFDQLSKQQKKLLDENKEPLIVQLKHYTDQMHLHGKQVATEMANSLQQQFDNHLRSTNAILQDTIISSVKAIVKEEIQHAMRDQQHILPDRLITHMRQSGTMTPVNLPTGSMIHQSNTVDVKTQINNFVQKGQLNSAFQVALCAADLNLLMNLCETVTPAQTFEVTVNNVTKKTQCQLQQPVILSLIQQLSQDLNTNTELKVKYLEEALLNLDLNNALTREHTPSVMNQLNLKIQQYVQQHPSNKSMRMLLMASQSLISQPKPQLKTPTHSQLQTPHHDNF
ncbi:unnamed protein product [Brachionus calyciflorus]|uniref:Enhancer of mRNA-decapping protein 4 WD40 repeat region domain-containing protein n=1 Tax=Brachionus calyciflorus TaxID=104777 RepID=A0A813M514_9BILA|nr:unnamed protein product [Brachionus calyciflorus]